MTSFILPASAAGLRHLWYGSYKTDSLVSSVHYTSSTVIVVYQDKFDKSMTLGKFAYCSGQRLDDRLLTMEPNILPDSIQTYDNRLFYVTNEKESEFNLVCTDLNLRQTWNYRFKDPIQPNLVWIETKDDLLVVNVDKGVLVFEQKNGRMLAKYESVYLLNRIYAGCILVKSERLSLVDPYTGISLWDYEIPKNGAWCFGIQKGLALLSTRPAENDSSTRAICLDAKTGKEVFSIEYNTEIIELGISRNLLCVVSKNDKQSFSVDAFNCENWIFQWSFYNYSECFLISENAIFGIIMPCQGTNYLTKIDPVSGKLTSDFKFNFHDFHNPRFFRKLVFQANRIIVADAGVDCYIDESF